jgi:hypothetical protein
MILIIKKPVKKTDMDFDDFTELAPENVDEKVGFY